MFIIETKVFWELDLQLSFRSIISLNNPYARTGTLKPADFTIARALTTQRDMLIKLNISYGFELTNFKISVCFNNIGLIQQLLEAHDTVSGSVNAHCLIRYEIICWFVFPLVSSPPVVSSTYSLANQCESLIVFQYSPGCKNLT